jgi:hypothetical protein
MLEAASRELTIGELVRYLLPEQGPPRFWPPPDVFAVAGSLLLQSGAYLKVVGDSRAWPPIGSRRRGFLAQEPHGWAPAVRQLGRQWRENWPKEPPLPIRRWWRTIEGAGNRALHELRKDSKLWNALLQLCAAADEASMGLGFHGSQDLADDEELDLLSYLTQQQLLRPEWVSLCRSIHPSRARVLPKCHTPQTGITLNSLTHNLALCRSGDVRPVWNDYRGLLSGDVLNVLLFPSPGTVYPVQFKAAASAGLAEDFGLFTFQPHRDPAKQSLEVELDRLYHEARKVTGKIDVVVLPELSLDKALYTKIRRWSQRHKVLLICGVGELSPQGRAGRNYVAFDTVRQDGSPVPIQQFKHHRWQLERSQIVRYGLGGQLNPERKWWEYIHPEERTLNFVSLRGGLTFCCLVCEDLARQEPVAQIVRAVGPNLVIALLMDGPQLASRWPARYATVLADDPGSSVLTLTSIGMTALSREAGSPTSRVVALWKDAKSGPAREIELPPGATGVVLAITRWSGVEWTADGRSDAGVAVTSYPSLAGVHPIELGSLPDRRAPRRKAGGRPARPLGKRADG